MRDDDGTTAVETADGASHDSAAPGAATGDGGPRRAAVSPEWACPRGVRFPATPTGLEDDVAELAVTAMGPDRPGIVAAVAEVLQERDGNVLDSAMTILGGRFSLALLVETGTPADELEAALVAATADLDLHLTVSAAGDATEHARPTHLLSVYGEDRPGLLAGVAATLADGGANITDLSTRLLGDDEPVYAIVLELSTDDEQGLRDRLAASADELSVDWTLRGLDDVTY